MYNRKDYASARKIAREQFNVNGLLSDPTSNPKTKKNTKLRVLTSPLHLAPGKLGGYQVCPMATPACLKLCLHTAGNPQYMDGKEKARLARKKLFFENRAVFLTVLHAELTRHVARAKKREMDAGIRLNATSDIAWETVRFPNGKNPFEEFSSIVFYDYTKIQKRYNAFLLGLFPSNYYLTFSATESNHEACYSYLRQGGTVAVAVDLTRSQAIPETLHGFPTVDADIDDYRPKDPTGHFAVLRAKGAAIGDTSGFVWNATMK